MTLKTFITKSEQKRHTRVSKLGKPFFAGSINNLDIKSVAERIKIPVEDWAGNCYAIAQKIVGAKLVKGKAVYGHWLGDVDTNSRFKKVDVGFVRHGWIEMLDGTIVDPTRWVFEGVKPYIYIGKNKGEYDKGGNMLRGENLGSPPEYNSQEKQIKCNFKKESLKFVKELLGTEKVMSQNQAFWIANLPLDMLGSFAKDIYTWLIKEGLGEFIPLDNRIEVMEKQHGA